MDEFLTQKDAARVLRLSQRTLERYRLTGMGPRFVKTGHRVLYRPSDIESWAAERTFGSTAEAEGFAAPGGARCPTASSR